MREGEREARKRGERVSERRTPFDRSFARSFHSLIIFGPSGSIGEKWREQRGERESEQSEHNAQQPVGAWRATHCRRRCAFFASSSFLPSAREQFLPPRVIRDLLCPGRPPRDSVSGLFSPPARPASFLHATEAYVESPPPLQLSVGRLFFRFMPRAHSDTLPPLSEIKSRTASNAHSRMQLPPLVRNPWLEKSLEDQSFNAWQVKALVNHFLSFRLTGTS